ncbi:MAG: 16S rRNA (cytidine(1402)-2'-O)-methyltransferase [Hyphomicrobiales bacterium]|nr:16S rRNA (cytidine(1402)-2'-O)-methyltransferase [Hyphomicrobiales bacterium]
MNRRTFSLEGAVFAAPAPPAGLHVVATPIGNLRDITLRALDILAGADAVLCEDTRVARTLMDHFAISATLIAYHEHNAAEMRPKILARLAAGEALALTSDAGTPLVSDPGYKLVGDALAAGAAVYAAPGASALLAGLVVAGLPTDAFFFAGFLPPKSAARRARLAELRMTPGTLVFYESPRRIAETLADCIAALGDRPAATARELTKKFETTRRGRLSDLAALYAQGEETRGEMVLLIAPPQPEEADEATLDARLLATMQTHSVKDAAAIVAGETGLPRREVYARALRLGGK